MSAMPDGGFLIADKTNDRIRRVAPDGTISTVAGSGNSGYNGEGLATAADLNKPEGVTALPDGGFLIADTGNNRDPARLAARDDHHGRGHRRLPPTAATTGSRPSRA